MKKMGAARSGSRFNTFMVLIFCLCIFLMILEAPSLFFTPPKLVVHRSDRHLSVVDSGGGGGDFAGDEFKETEPAPAAASSNATKATAAVAPTHTRDLQQVADLAMAAGARMWDKVEAAAARMAAVTKNGTVPRGHRRAGVQEKCPQVVMVNHDKRSNGTTLSLPCGLATGSSITIVGRPRKAHVETSPHISIVSDGKDEEMVSQFMVELRGLKMAAGEDPPRILHLNPRLRGDWSGRPVIELNTCYRGQWSVSQRCEGWLSPDSEPSVDGLPKCENWLHDEAGNTSNSGDDIQSVNRSWWPMNSRAEKAEKDWLYPFAEERLFVLTIRAGWDGYHVTVDGRHITSFPYRTGFILADATGLAIDGDVDVRSVVATGLPSAYTTSEQQLEESEKYKAPKLPDTERVHLFIGIMSASTHFAERMAVRKSWLQSPSILSSQVVARFFVGVHADIDVDLQLKEEAEYFGDMVILPFMDHYDLVVLKTIAICEYAVKNITANHIMKTDDDTFVRVETISNVLKKKHKAPGLYMGNINQYHRPLREGKWAVSYEEWSEEEYPAYANGPGYIISADIAKFIVEQKEKRTLKLFKMEDVNMGMWVKQYNGLKDVQYVQNLKFVQWGCEKGYYTAHYQSPRQMLCMWDKLQKGEALCCNMR